MVSFDSNDPREFGWSLDFRAFVPFVYGGHSFPQGVHPAAHDVFTQAMDRLLQAGLQLPPPSMGLDAGMWGQEDRQTKSGGSISFHQYGLAIDVCAPWNPWRVADPPASPHRLGDNTSSLVEPLGLLWGGGPRWGSNRDRMHLEVHASPQELGHLSWPPPTHPAGKHPFPLPIGWYYGPLSGPARSISGVPASDAPYRAGLQAAQRVLGVPADGRYGPVTAAATTRWQAAHHLVVDGLIGPATWTSLFA